MSVPKQFHLRTVLLRAQIQSLWVRFRKAYVLTLVALFVVVFIPLSILFVPPYHFPKGELISIPADSTSEEIADELADQHVIRSAAQFRIYTRLTGDDRTLQSGIYVFDHALGLVSVAHRIANGDHGIEESRVTLTEGMTNKDMARTIAAGVPGFDTKAFLEQASTSEGYLFPDTYFILPGTTPEDMVLRLRTQFDTKILTIQKEVDASKMSLNNLVILASILEREAQGIEDMRMVSGILNNRLRIDMPLQVDAVFGYVHGENGYTPTAADLESDSPYNTYRVKGLPPTPIANPGLDALKAAATPKTSTYLYYLTGKDGEMHYARTFEEHKRNRELYLN
ncbi:MAG: UPF0755 protein [Parcubacteria bacterium C7867-008]|nr:MAG: UPF0755 protein [Parcubacteria bacterium C7867-008]